MGASEDEDDYLTMTFTEPSTVAKTETLTQKKKRLAREAEERGRPKSKAELAEMERVKREEALSKSTLDTSSKGFKMLAKLGYKPGTALGKDRVGGGAEEEDGGKAEVDKPKDDRLLQPIGLEMREGRSGIGADSEKKRKFREEVERKEEGEKRVKVDEGEFRERTAREREEKRMEGQVWGAMKVAERLDEEDALEGVEGLNLRGGSKPLRGVNVLWRGLVKGRLEKERDKRMRYDLQQSLSRLPTYDDPDEDKEDQIALGKKESEVVDGELDEDDEELQEFDALPVQEKLGRLVGYLRERWNYCFWCKYRYPDKEMEGCPGRTEEEHD